MESHNKFSTEELIQIYHRKVLNQELSLKEFEEKKLVLRSRPSKLIVELTENCNFRCIMCSQAFDPKYAKYNESKNMTLSMFKKVAEEMFHHAYFVDLRGFGESTMLPHWPEIVDYLERFPLVNWHLVTNLSMPRDDLWDKAIQQGFMLGISWDAATKETFETIRVRSHYEKLLHNLKLVSDAVNKHKRGFLYFIVTVQKRNVDELPGIIEIAKKHSVNEVQFKIVRQFDSFMHHDEMIAPQQRDSLTRSIEASLDLALSSGVRLTVNDSELTKNIDQSKVLKAGTLAIPPPGLNFPPPRDLDPDFTDQHQWANTASAIMETAKVSVHQRCFKPYHYTYITPDGRVGTCNHMMNPEVFEMGNLNSQGFEEIWNGDDYQFFRSGLVNQKPLDPRCKWCFKYRLED